MIIYGKSGNTFARDLFYDESGENPDKTDNWEEALREGNKLVEDYLDTFSGLKKWLNDTKKFAKKHGYSETMLGRRRRLPDLKSSVYRIKSDAERQAINAPIQGTGTDLTLLSLIQLNNWMKENKLKSMIIATVHDSLVFDVYLPELPTVAKKVKEVMESVHEEYIETDIPILSDLELGVNYGATFEVDLEDCLKINSKETFKKWKKVQDIEKYKGEISILKKANWPEEDIRQYLKTYNRPVDLLEDEEG